MHALIAFLAMLILLAATAEAQDKRIAPKDSRILLLEPYLEDLSPTYQDFGWNARASVETAYAGVARGNSIPSRAQVYLRQTAPLMYWRLGTTLDAAWISSSFPFFKSRTVVVTSPAPPQGPFVRIARFEVENAKCMAFELRHVTNDTGAPTPEERQSVTGIYCPPANVVLDDALIQRVFEGIFVRRDGRIERALRGVDKPIPPQLLRGEQQQG
ncbi:MAG: hypothetical protein HYZ40_08675 [Rhodospirillales bacterium]|nr:hypothetical protein [Rhodospirillales bacterium]